MNYPVNRTDFKIVRGVRCVVDLYIKDVDRKPVTIAPGTVPTIHIVNRVNNELVLSLPLVLAEAARAHWVLTIPATAAVDWANGFYDYAVTLTSDAGVDGMLFTDQDYDTKGFLEVVDGPIPKAKPPVVLTPRSFLAHGFPSKLYSGAIAGTLQTQATAAQTAKAVVTGFTGVITIQTIEGTMPSPVDELWTDVGAIEMTTASGEIALPVVPATFWLRFVIAGTGGSVDQIVLQG
jgi:hypothetical protein